MKEKPKLYDAKASITGVEEKVLTMAAIRKFKNQQLSDWEKNFVENIEDRLQKGELTENQRTWLNRLKKKYLQ